MPRGQRILGLFRWLAPFLVLFCSNLFLEKGASAEARERTTLAGNGEAEIWVVPKREIVNTALLPSTLSGQINSLTLLETCSTSNGARKQICLVPRDWDSSIRARYFNEIWIDYVDFEGRADFPGTVQIDYRLPTVMDGAVDNTKSESVLQGWVGKSGLIDAVVSRVNARKGQWKEKTLLYSIRRELNLAFDENWYYIQDGPVAVVQKRFDQDLSEIDAFEIILRNDSPFLRMNFRFWTPEGGMQLLEWTQLKTSIRDVGAYKSYRVEWKDVVKSEDVYLREIIAFFSGDVQSVVSNRPFKEIVFLQEQQDANTRAIRVELKSRVIDLKNGLKRLIIEQTPLQNMEGGGRLESIKIYPVTECCSESSLLLIQSVQFANPSLEKSVLDNPCAELIERWGGGVFPRQLLNAQYLRFMYCFGTIFVSPLVFRQSGLVKRFGQH